MSGRRKKEFDLGEFMFGNLDEDGGLDADTYDEETRRALSKVSNIKELAKFADSSGDEDEKPRQTVTAVKPGTSQPSWPVAGPTSAGKVELLEESEDEDMDYDAPDAGKSEEQVREQPVKNSLAKPSLQRADSTEDKAKANLAAMLGHSASGDESEEDDMGEVHRSLMAKMRSKLYDLPEKLPVLCGGHRPESVVYSLATLHGRSEFRSNFALLQTINDYGEEHPQDVLKPGEDECEKFSQFEREMVVKKKVNTEESGLWETSSEEGDAEDENAHDSHEAGAQEAARDGHVPRTRHERDAWVFSEASGEDMGQPLLEADDVAPGVWFNESQLTNEAHFHPIVQVAWEEDIVWDDEGMQRPRPRTLYQEPEKPVKKVFKPAAKPTPAQAEQPKASASDKKEAESIAERLDQLAAQMETNRTIHVKSPSPPRSNGDNWTRLAPISRTGRLSFVVNTRKRPRPAPVQRKLSTQQPRNLEHAFEDFHRHLSRAKPHIAHFQPSGTREVHKRQPSQSLTHATTKRHCSVWNLQQPTQSPGASKSTPGAAIDTALKRMKVAQMQRNGEFASMQWLDWIMWDETDADNLLKQRPPLFDVVLDENDSAMIFEEDIKGAEPIVEDIASLEGNRFNTSNDKFYRRRVQIKRKTKVLHSKPAQRLSTKLFLTDVKSFDWTAFRRPLARMLPNTPYQINTLVGTSWWEDFVTSSGNRGVKPPSRWQKLSANDGRVVLLEYIEEHPVVTMDVGMGVRFVQFYRQRDEDDADFEPQHADGVVHCLHPNDVSPFALGDVEEGTSITAVQSPLFAAPAFRHQKPVTDFLLFRTPGSQVWNIRDIQSVFNIGQLQPEVEVPLPRPRTVAEKLRARIKAHYLLHTNSNKGVPPTREQMLAVFPNSAADIDSIITEVQSSSNPNAGAAKKSIVAEALEKSPPESLSALETALHYKNKLNRYGLKSLLHIPTSVNFDDVLQLLDEHERPLARQLREELLLTPWNLSSNFMAAKDNEQGMLKLKDPLGSPLTGDQGFSYAFIMATREEQKKGIEQSLKSRHESDKALEIKDGKKQKTEADLRKLNMTRLASILRYYGVPDEEIDGLHRWKRVQRIRDLATEAALQGDSKYLRFARKEKTSHAGREKKYIQIANEVLQRQVQVLSYTGDPAKFLPRDNTRTNRLRNRVRNQASALDEEDEEVDERAAAAALMRRSTVDSKPEEVQVEEGKVFKDEKGRMVKRVKKQWLKSVTRTVVDGRLETKEEVLKDEELVHIFKQELDEGFLKGGPRLRAAVARRKRAEARGTPQHRSTARRTPGRRTPKRQRTPARPRKGKTTPAAKPLKPLPTGPDGCPLLILGREQTVIQTPAPAAKPPKIVGGKLVLSTRPSPRPGSRAPRTPRSTPRTPRSARRPGRRRADMDKTLHKLLKEAVSAMERCAHRLQVHEHFDEPVSKTTYPHYASIIKTPMCFQSLNGNIGRASYSTWYSFWEDAKLIYLNCKKFNGAEHQLTRHALTILEAAVRKMQGREQDIRDAEHRIRMFNKKMEFLDNLEAAVQVVKDTMPEHFYWFREPVPTTVPGYYEKVKQPMDLSTLKKRVGEGKYHTVADFVKDLNLIVTNSSLYNGPQHNVTRLAREVVEVVSKELRKGPQDMPRTPAPNSVAASPFRVTPSPLAARASPRPQPQPQPQPRPAAAGPSPVPQPPRTPDASAGATKPTATEHTDIPGDLLG